MTKTTLALFGIIFLFQSCDPAYLVKFNNETNRQIILKINFDSIGLKQYSWGNNLGSKLKSYSKGFNTTDLDTVNLTAAYIVNSGSSMTLYADLASPKFDLFNNMTIICKDTIQLKNKQEIKMAFKQTGNRIWQLTVK